MCFEQFFMCNDFVLYGLLSEHFRRKIVLFSVTTATSYLLTTSATCFLILLYKLSTEIFIAKTSWRVLLFRAIFGITGALVVCFDIWWFKQANNSETGFGGHHCDFDQHVPCLTVHLCMNSMKFVLEAPGASILWGRYYSMTMCRLTQGALLLGRMLLIGTLRYCIYNHLSIIKGHN